MNRRFFLKILIIAPIVRINVSHASNKGRLGISALNIFVPAWLFDEKNIKKTSVQALAIEEDKDAGTIVVLFDRNKKLTLNPNTSVQWLIQKNANRQTRESMLLKRIMSYGLEAIFLTIADKRHPEMGATLKDEFDALQAEEVISVITVGAIYDLLSKLNGLKMISSVSWDSGKQRFIVR
ncbi:hypothetical protein [Desulfosarcina cetonica]|uniref:hypothetical protein n=1 Tax=Desulfosarcina cetonica TaxID=90730 RepID=UPI0012ED9A92|nr:hypothetical protein [Desulfosarcina cetonica]